MNARSRLAGLVVALTVTTSLVGACNSGPDPKDQITRELKDANINNIQVDYDHNTNVVHLKGAVDSSAERLHAEEIAHKAVGTSGVVANEISVNGVDDQRADMDKAIQRELNVKVNNDRAFENRHITFEVNNGIVTIKGDVGSEVEKQQVNEMVRSTENVKDVVNALEIRAQNRP
jgi:hyperosmotically inducible periplasmic protein